MSADIHERKDMKNKETRKAYISRNKLFLEYLNKNLNIVKDPKNITIDEIDEYF